MKQTLYLKQEYKSIAVWLQPHAAWFLDYLKYGRTAHVKETMNEALMSCIAKALQVISNRRSRMVDYQGDVVEMHIAGFTGRPFAPTLSHNRGLNFAKAICDE